MSCAYRPQGNGICECGHRTIKTIVARTGHTVEDAVFWHNATTATGGTSPFEKVFGAKPKLPGVQYHRQVIDQKEDDEEELQDQEEIAANPFVVRDKVFVRSSGRCMDAWSGPHRVTQIWSPVAVEIGGDGIKRHVSHMRLVPGSRVEGILREPSEVEDADLVQVDMNEEAVDNAVVDNVTLGRG